MYVEALVLTIKTPFPFSCLLICSRFKCREWRWGYGHVGAHGFLTREEDWAEVWRWGLRPAHIYDEGQKRGPKGMERMRLESKQQ
jgi:hypothetical protein